MRRRLPIAIAGFVASALLLPETVSRGGESVSGDGAGSEPAAGRGCLEYLRGKKVAFAEAPATRGIRTPMRLLGPLGPVRLVSRERRDSSTPLMDCELGRALLDMAPAFASLGIRELIYSGTYQYRTRRGSNKLSEHARGLAIDVHAFVMADGTVYVVQRDFESGVGTWAVTEASECVGSPVSEAGRVLRRLACSLRASSVFREVITADDNSDHGDHFHIEAYPDAFTRAKAVLGRGPPSIDD
jgi:hypothetical protein